MENGDPYDLADFHSSVDEPLHRPDPYVLARLSRQLDGFTQAARQEEVDLEFILRLRRGVLDGFQRLDALPRDDPFWDRTNHRPTLGKAFEFSRKLHAVDPGDVRALWTLAGVSLLTWQNFEPGLWSWFVQAGG